MNRNYIVYWIAFASIFASSLFIPVFEFHKPGNEDPWVFPVWGIYVSAWHLLTAFSDVQLWIMAIGFTILHFTAVAVVAMWVTIVYRHLTNQAAQPRSVLSCPDPSRSEWDTFLADSDNDKRIDPV